MGAGGGDLVANGFTISTSSTTVLAYIIGTSFVPPGDGTLLDLGGICSNITVIVAVTDYQGTQLDVELTGTSVVEANQYYDEDITGWTYSYTPQDLNIVLGESVEWYNIWGSHSIDGVTNSVTGEPFNNPEEFYFEGNYYFSN